jgi:hypothetical protein
MANFSDVKTQVETFLSGNSPKSEIVFTNQMERVAEAELRGIDSYLNIDSDGLTDKMKSEFVNPISDTLSRLKAQAENYIRQLNDIRDNLSSDKINQEIGSIDSDTERAVEAIDERYSNKEWKDKKKAKEQAEQVYDDMLKANSGKPPTHLPWWYFIFLMLIGVGEWLINFATFESKFAVTAMAIGMTMLVALAFSAASHFHGEFIKQRIALTGSHVEKSKRRNIYIVQTIVTILFLISFAAVVITRYQVIEDQVTAIPDAAITLPGFTNTVTRQSALQLLVPTLLLNMTVWILGIVISYAVHDSIPGFYRAYVILQKARSSFEKEDRKKREEVEQKRAAGEKAKQELLAKLDYNDKQVKLCDQYAERLRQFIKVSDTSFEKRINDTVNTYRGVLANVARRLNKAAIKIGPKQLSLEQYLEENIGI